MRLIGKLLALPFMLVTGILYLVCKFLVVLSGAVLGILSGIIFLAALVLFFVAGFLPGHFITEHGSVAHHPHAVHFIVLQIIPLRLPFCMGKAID